MNKDTLQNILFCNIVDDMNERERIILVRELYANNVHSSHWRLCIQCLKPAEIGRDMTCVICKKIACKECVQMSDFCTDGFFTCFYCNWNNEGDSD